MNPRPLATFLSYSHANQKLRKKLREHFVQLERDELIRLWDDRELRVGQEFDASISERLELTDVFILLVSQDFIASQYCSGVEMKRALERHEDGTALVLPIIATPCDWKHSPLAKLLVAPTGGKPISNWSPRDAGWTDATTLAREAIASFRERFFSRRPVPILAAPPPPPALVPIEARDVVAAAPATPAPRAEKTELVPLYVTLPGFQMPKVVTGADQEETARVTFESIPPQVPGSVEKTESLEAPPLLTPLPPPVETTVRLSETPPLPAQPAAGPPAAAPSPEAASTGLWTKLRQSRVAVSVALLFAVVLLAAASAFVCSWHPDPEETRPWR